MPSDNDDTKKDLTRLEDLSEFLHQDDENVESLLNEHNSDFTELSSLEDELPPPLEENLEQPPEFIEENTDLSRDESNFETSDNENESPFDYSNENSSADFSSETEEGFASDVLLDSGDTTFIDSEFSDSDTSLNENFNEDIDTLDNISDTNEDISVSAFVSEIKNENQKNQTEKLDEIKTFANNFSYGAVNKVGGNPPFSVKILNIKYQEDAEDMKSILSEFEIINASNEKEFNTAFKLGSVLIPQINEYAAIIISHKFRRFDCDIEVGLSDEIHPDKSGEHYSKGFVKKSNVNQNRKEKFTPINLDLALDDIQTSTTSSLEGYEIKRNLGVHTVFSIITVEEMNRLHYVQKAKRENQVEDDQETKEAFDAYEESFQKAYDNLLYELKVKALKNNANAIVGISYQVNPLNNESYNLVCSATFVSVEIRS